MQSEDSEPGVLEPGYQRAAGHDMVGIEQAVRCAVEREQGLGLQQGALRLVGQARLVSAAFEIDRPLGCQREDRLGADRAEKAILYRHQELQRLSAR